MDTLLVVVIVVVLILAVIGAIAKGGGKTGEFRYQLRSNLLSNAERSFYGVLVQAVGSSGLVFTKVRVADVLTPIKALGRSDWQKAFNTISSKHFDFLICDPQTCALKLAVELDDSSHETAKAQRRDRFLNGACESAGLRLLRINAARSYSLTDLKRQIEEAVSPPSEPSSKAEYATKAQPEASQQLRPAEPAAKGMIIAPVALQDGSANPTNPTEDVTAPPCPKCSEPMLRRKAKAGANAGKEFWGCSAFPKCRGVANYGEKDSSLQISK